MILDGLLEDREDIFREEILKEKLTTVVKEHVIYSNPETVQGTTELNVLSAISFLIFV